MRTLRLMAMMLPVTFCLVAATPSPPASTGKDDSAALTEVEAKLTKTGSQGSEAGRLYEQRGELLLRLGRTKDAADSYDSAARAYSQSPEGTGMPEINSERARKRAEAIRKGAN